MAFREANDWFNFSCSSLDKTPNGWLLNPQSSFLILFEKSKKSSRQNIKVYTHHLFAKHLGETSGLKNRRLHHLNCAFETWNELIAGGWTKVTNQYNESA